MCIFLFSHQYVHARMQGSSAPEDRGQLFLSDNVCLFLTLVYARVCRGSMSLEPFACHNVQSALIRCATQVRFKAWLCDCTTPGFANKNAHPLVQGLFARGVKSTFAVHGPCKTEYKAWPELLIVFENRDLQEPTGLCKTDAVKDRDHLHRVAGQKPLSHCQ